MNIVSRLNDFESSLIGFESNRYASWQIGQIYNVLLAEVKKNHGDDPIVQVLETATKRGTTDTANKDYGTLLTATRQLLEVVENR